MVKVNQDECIGCGTCASICSEVFEMGDDNKAHIKSGAHAECVDEAIESCPVDAISK